MGMAMTMAMAMALAMALALAMAVALALALALVRELLSKNQFFFNFKISQNGLAYSGKS